MGLMSAFDFGPLLAGLGQCGSKIDIAGLETGGVGIGQIRRQYAIASFVHQQGLLLDAKKLIKVELHSSLKTVRKLPLQMQWMCQPMWHIQSPFHGLRANPRIQDPRRAFRGCRCARIFQPGLIKQANAVRQNIAALGKSSPPGTSFAGQSERTKLTGLMRLFNRTLLSTRCRRIAFGIIVLVFGTVPTALTAKPDLQPLEEIRQAAKLHVQNELATPTTGTLIRPGNLDSRLKLGRCLQELRTFTAGGSATTGNVSIGVECPGSWRLFVPISIETHQPVIVLRRASGRAEPLQADHLATEIRNTRDLSRGYFSDPEQVIGQVLRRSASAGVVLTPAMLEAARLIEKGQVVRLLTSLGGVQVMASGTAMASAAEGQRITVRNMSSNKLVEGIVTGPDTVTIR